MPMLPAPLRLAHDPDPGCQSAAEPRASHSVARAYAGLCCCSDDIYDCSRHSSSRPSLRAGRPAACCCAVASPAPPGPARCPHVRSLDVYAGRLARWSHLLTTRSCRLCDDAPNTAQLCVMNAVSGVCTALQHGDGRMSVVLGVFCSPLPATLFSTALPPRALHAFLTKTDGQGSLCASKLSNLQDRTTGQELVHVGLQHHVTLGTRSRQQT